MCRVIDLVKTGKNIERLLAERGLTAKDVQQRLALQSGARYISGLQARTFPQSITCSFLQKCCKFRLMRFSSPRMNTYSREVKIHMSEIVHQPGKLDFLIVTKDVSVTEFRRKPSAVWAYLKTPGHVIFFTRRGKRNCAIMSIETHACLSGDYEKTMREIEEAAAAWREEQKALRRARREAKSGTGKDCSNADGAKDA